MAKCEICDKGVSFGIKVSHSHRRSNKMWKPNIRRVRAIVNGEHKKIYVCTRCLRSGKVRARLWQRRGCSRSNRGSRINRNKPFGESTGGFCLLYSNKTKPSFILCIELIIQ